MKTTLPSPHSLALELIQDRRSRYLADLHLLLAKTTRCLWAVEMAQVEQEIAHLQAVVQSQPPAVGTFDALAKLQARFAQDVSLLSRASATPRKAPAPHWSWLKAFFGSTATGKSGNPAPVFHLSLHSSTVC